MTPGTFFSFLAALLLLYTPAKRLSRVRNELQQTMGAAERVIEFLETPAEIYRPAGSREASPLARSIVFENVSFRYEGRKRDALEDVSLEVRAGEVIALVGASGGGKTTLVNLLPGSTIRRPAGSSWTGPASGRSTFPPFVGRSGSWPRT